MNYICIKDLCIKYKDQIIFDNANLSISKPGFYCLIGRNGSGKTTLLESISQLRKINSGEIVIDSSIEDITYCSKESLSISKFSVFDNLKLVSNDINRINELCELFNISRILKSKISKCSAGEKQRICIIRSILQDNKILLIDESLCHIDDYNSEIILNYLKDLSCNHIIIYSTHYENDILKYSDCNIVIKNKQLYLEAKNDRENEFLANNLPTTYSNNLLKTIIRWKGDYLFAALFIILISLTLISVWLLNLSKERVYKEYQTKSSNIEYNVIDDNETNPHITNNINSYNNNDEFINNIINSNNKIKKGLKNVYLFYDSTMTFIGNLNIDYVLFDNSLSNDYILVNNIFYTNAYDLEYIDESNYFNYGGCKFKVEIINGNYTFDYFICNEKTFLKLCEYNDRNVIYSNYHDVNIINGRSPEKSDEIALFSKYLNNYDNYDSSNNTITINIGSVSKTFNVVGFYDSYDLESTLGYKFYLITKDALNFVEEGNVYDFNYYYIAYCNSRDLTINDYKYILDNNMCINNDVLHYSTEASNFIISIKHASIILLIFVITFDVLVILYYIQIYKKNNIENIKLLKILNKTNDVKKNLIINKIIIGFIIMFVSLSLFTIIQTIINNSLIQTTIRYINANKIVTINYYFNEYLYYCLPTIIIIQLGIIAYQLRLWLK